MPIVAAGYNYPFSTLLHAQYLSIYLFTTDEIVINYNNILEKDEKKFNIICTIDRSG